MVLWVNDQLFLGKKTILDFGIAQSISENTNFPASTTSKFAWAENPQCLFQKKMVSKIPLKWMVTIKHEQNLLEFRLVPK